MNSIYKELGFSIVIQAIKDYRTLQRHGVDKLIKNKQKKLDKREIEDFFRSDWCDFLLCNMRLTGEDILRYLNRE